MANITTVMLIKCPLESDYKHTLYFNSPTAQHEYFSSRQRILYQDCSYQRKEGVIRLPDSYDTVIRYNYVAYQNDGKKWYYAFIKDYEFKNDSQTDITIETDVLQTYMFDYEFKPCFVEREHTDNDTIGLNTIPENLEMGEYICKSVTRLTKLTSYYVIVGVTQTPGKERMVGRVYDGIFSGICYYGFEASEEGYEKLEEFISSYDSGDAIVCMFLYPKELTALQTSGDGVLVEDEALEQIATSLSPHAWEHTELKTPSAISELNVKNNKLKTYPYRYLLVSNNNGGSAIYQYEHFQGDNMNFKIEGCITPGGSIRLVPRDYKGITINHEEGLNFGKLPICNWTSDEFTNWLTQNSLNIGINLATGVGQIVGGIAMSGTGVGAVVGGGMALSGASAITNQLTQIHQMSFTPPQSRGNTNCGDVVTAMNSNTFHFYHMSIKDEYLRVIDEYLSMFGYKVNRVKIPFKNHREKWWFTKTIDANITDLSVNGGTIRDSVPVKDMLKIKECYDNGITFWRNPTEIKNYSLDNNIIE